MNTQYTMPVVDLGRSCSAGAADPSLAQAVRDASRGSGLFYVSNHGVPASLIAAHFAVARAFFDLDLDEKRSIDVGRSNCFRGYEAFGTQTIDAAAPGDLKEGFVMGPDLASDHPHVLARYPNTGANLWPLRPAGFRRHMETYVDAMNGLGRKLAGVLAVSLDLPADYFGAPLVDPLTYSQLLHYPSVPAQAFANRQGAGAHRDYGMLTILLQDEVGGLEVLYPDTGWHAAPPMPGTFVVILGEMMLRLTNGFYRSALHRVAKNTSGRSRYSMPTFFDPGYDYRVECVPTCRPADGEPRYPACTVGRHMLEMAREPLSPTAAAV